MKPLELLDFVEKCKKMRESANLPPGCFSASARKRLENAANER